MKGQVSRSKEKFGGLNLWRYVWCTGKVVNCKAAICSSFLFIQSTRYIFTWAQWGYFCKGFLFPKGSSLLLRTSSQKSSSCEAIFLSGKLVLKVTLICYIVGKVVLFFYKRIFLEIPKYTQESMLNAQKHRLFKIFKCEWILIFFFFFFFYYFAVSFYEVHCMCIKHISKENLGNTWSVYMVLNSITWSPLQKQTNKQIRKQTK